LAFFSIGSPKPGRLPIAMVGKTYCMVDATYAAVGIGDLLISSGTAGTR
jgi:hypothetical protein